MRYSHQALIGVIVFSFVLVAVYVRRHRRKNASTDASRERLSP